LLTSGEFCLWRGLQLFNNLLLLLFALFIYTDGLNEAEDPEQRQFGDERLLDILRNTHFDTAQQVIETLAADVAAHRQGAEPNDDLTMMCLRVS